MDFVDAIDVSNNNGPIDFSQVPQPIVIMKASEGTTFLDPWLFRYYDQAKHQSGKAVGLYHFASGGDAVVEADWFISCCQPLEVDDVLVLDFEIHISNPVDWCLNFVNRVHAQTGVWPLVYLNLSTLRGYNWHSVLDNCGLWIAEPDYGPDDEVPTGEYTYVMHQYGEGPVPGTPKPVDLDRWWGTVEQFKKYGWNHTETAPSPQPDPTPTPDPVPPTPEPTPVPVPEPTPTEPAPTPEPVPTPSPTPVPPVEKPLSLRQKVLNFLIGFLESLK